MNKTLVLVVVCLAMVTFVCLDARAAGRDDVTTLKNGRITITTEGASKTSTPHARENADTPPAHRRHPTDFQKGTYAPPANLMFDNLGTAYSDGVYWCCEGATIWGRDNTIRNPPIEYGEAANFPQLPGAWAVTEIDVAVGWVNYGEKYTNVIVSLNADNNGVPGTPYKTWKVQIGGDFGSCCVVTTAKESQGIPFGWPAWVVVRTEKTSDVWAAWNLNDTAQLSTEAIPEAFWCSTTGSGCGSHNNVWTAYSGYPGFAFAVYGDCLAYCK
jgi:hypothetical protein